MNFCVFFNFNHPFRSNLASVSTVFSMVASNFIGKKTYLDWAHSQDSIDIIFL